jgi:HrpA-like RNA helicase
MLSPLGAEVLTPLGEHLARLPLDVRLGKIIILGALLKCTDDTLTVAALLSGRSVFRRPMGQVRVHNACSIDTLIAHCVRTHGHTIHEQTVGVLMSRPLPKAVMYSTWQYPTDCML